MPDYPVAKVLSNYPNLKLVELDSNGEEIDASKWVIEVGLEFVSKKIYLRSTLHKDYSRNEIEKDTFIAVELKPNNIDWSYGEPRKIPLSFFGSKEEIKCAKVFVHSKQLSNVFLEHNEVGVQNDECLIFNIQLDKKEFDDLKDSILHPSYDNIEFNFGLEGVYADGIELRDKLKILRRTDKVLDSDGIDLWRFSKIRSFNYCITNKVESNKYE